MDDAISTSLKNGTNLSVNFICESIVQESQNKTKKGKIFKQYSIKMPTEIVREYNIKKGDRLRFIVEVSEQQKKQMKVELLSCQTQNT